ncbi:flagellar biosynthesis protein FlhA [Aquabacterium sp. OR-4]|uniref:flagellar biosynthesis protein FlhA n=1 Tax=Aquabacterium sp. OR-4 TaxID=2978127 RepID=UPI0028C569C1|nr:flagellar biosynthesis protein FlhA [Aquabacterium sp. OR-4]MDT7836035.1 flagellar biosynthesis protein FlhA [Aquabacterium sp. OR-4]
MNTKHKTEGPSAALLGSGRDMLQLASGGLGRHSDLLLIGLFVAIIALMVLPLPAWLLDTLIAANLTAAVVVLIVAMYIGSPLGLSTFPALLLFTTLFRLALNIASTRQILLTGHAGDIIKTFGQMVVGGDVIVGLVVFLIIALVQFIVIAKGSERIAEVSARFSLDAMPGKQMSIDADLRAGLIAKDEARARRHALESESQLYGAMDGAMKFVKGDAVAAIIIAAVNIIGGIAVGMLRKDMSLDAATRLYSVLAVGDAMVSQIPSLLMSVAAGVVVTRVAGKDGKSGNLAQDILGQVAAHPRGLMIAGSVVALMGLVPGFPMAQFVLLGAAAGAGGWWASPAQQRRRQGTQGQPMAALVREGSDQVQQWGEAPAQAWAAGVALRLDATVFERLDARLLDEAVGTERLRLQQQLGLPFPGLMLVPATHEAPAGQLVFEVHGVPVLSLAFDSLEAANDGPEAALAQALRQVIEARASRFMGVQEALVLTQMLEAQMPELERELRQCTPLPRLAEVARRLLDEGVSLRDLPGLAQALVDHAAREKDTTALVEKVRQALGDQITHQHANAKGELAALVLAPELEDQLAAALRASVQGSHLALPHAAREGLLLAMAQAMARRQVPGLRTVLLVHTATLRPALRVLLRDSSLADRAVLCAGELRANLNVLVVDEIGPDSLAAAAA